MIEQDNQDNLEQAIAIYNKMSVDEKAKFVKHILGNSSLFLYVINFLDKEQIAEILRAIAYLLQHKS